MGQKLDLNKEYHAVLLYSASNNKWEEQIARISAIYTASIYGNFIGYDIYFKGGGKFFYKAANVQILNLVKRIDISKYDVYVDGNLAAVTFLDQFEKGYYRVGFSKSNIFIGEVELKSNKYKDVLDYFSGLSNYAETIAEADSPLLILSQSFKRFSLSRESVLFDFLQGHFQLIRDKDAVIVPFDFNHSQSKAISKMLTNGISIIEGPPGTGKTQTILNLISNILYRGKNCAIVSNNNTAIDNVYEKLAEERLSFFAVRLGSQKNVDQSLQFDQNETLLEFLNSPHEQTSTSDLQKLNHLMTKLTKIHEIEAQTAILKTQLLDLDNENRHIEKNEERIEINTRLSPNDYMALIQRLEKPKKIRLFERWRYGWKFRVKISKIDVNDLLSSAEKLFYQKKLSEISNQIAINEKQLSKLNKGSATSEIKALSKKFLNTILHKRYEGIEIRNFTNESYKKDYSNFLQRYPVVLSTTHSLVNNVTRGFTFDYLIIDEASQGDLLSSVLAMNCAKNLVVVGDSKQLQQIDEERLYEKSQELAIKYGIGKAYYYHENSILRSAKLAIEKVPITVLREHYRCAPDIINFCNKIFYDDELIVMTKNSGQHIKIIKTVPGNHARKNPNGSGLYNQREIDEIKGILSSSVSNNVGVITPFRCQANIIGEKYIGKSLEADTVHKFQGRQKDEVILSFVVNDLNKSDENVENRLYDFVTNKELLNVAISRAKTKLTAIVSDKVFNSSNNAIVDFIKYTEYLYGSQASEESTVKSVFDFLYSEYTKALFSKYEENPEQHKTELLMRDVIKEVLKDHYYINFSMHTRLGKIINTTDEFSPEEKEYILHPWTHVDFLFYNRVSKESLFVLEVDGIRFHEQDKKQSIHDDIKNRVLNKNNIPIYRFKTNESNEKARLEEIVRKYLH